MPKETKNVSKTAPAKRNVDRVSPRKAASNDQLAQKFATLTRVIPWSGWWLTKLEEQGWRVNHCSDEQAGGYFWLRARTHDRAQERFQLAPEILILLSSSHVQQAFLDRMHAQLTASQGRLDAGVVIIVDPVDNLAARLGTLHAPGCVVAWGRDEQRDLFSAIATALPLSDPFDVRSPVRGRDRIGREAMVSALIRDVQNHSAIVVLGLRKMGKTTVVRAMIDKIDPRPNTQNPKSDEKPDWLVCYMDAQLYLDTGIQGLGGAIMRDLRERCSFALPAKRASPIAELRWAIEQALQHMQRVCLVIDEFDWLMEEEYAYKSDTVVLLAVLRGMTQTFSDRFRIIFIGRLPDRLNGAKLFGQANPALNMFRPFWVGPMERDESDELLSRLGKRAGLDVGPGSQNEGWRLAMGHPLMARLFGSALLSRISKINKSAVNHNVSTDSATTEASKALLRADDARSNFEEVKNLLTAINPRAFHLLKELALKEIPGHWETAQDNEPDEARLLVHFGLVDENTGSIPGVLIHFVRPLPKREVSTA